MRKNIKKKIVFFGLLLLPSLVLAQSYLPDIAKAKEWKDIFPLDISINDLLTTSPQFPEQKIPIYIYKPNFDILIDYAFKNSNAKEFVLPNNKTLQNNNKIKSYLLQLQNGNYAELLPLLEKKVGINKEKNQLFALWAAQIYYLQENFQKANQFLSYSYLSKDNAIAFQTEYLQSLIYLKKKEYTKILQKIKNWQLNYPGENIPDKNYILYIYALSKQKKYSKTLQEIQGDNFSAYVDIPLLRAILFYNTNSFNNAHSNFESVDLDVYSGKENEKIQYFELWTSFFIKKNYIKKKKNFEKSLLKKNLSEWQYLEFLEKLQAKKANYQDAKNLSSNIFFMIALLFLDNRIKLTKEQKFDLFQQNIPSKQTHILYFYYLKKATYYQKQKNYAQSFFNLSIAKYYAEFLPYYITKKTFTNLNFLLAIVYFQQNKIEEAREIIADLNIKNIDSSASYYLAYIYYLQKDSQKLLELLQKITFPANLRDEFVFLRAWANYQLGNKKAVINQLQNTKSNIARSLLYSIYLQNKAFSKITNTYNTKEKNSYNLDKIYILALIRNNESKQALQYLLDTKKYKIPLYYSLYIEVLIANKKHQESLDFLLKETDYNTSVQFSAYLAKSYFLVKNYSESIRYLEQTIILAGEINTIDYNIFLNLTFLDTPFSDLMANIDKNKSPQSQFEKVLVLNPILKQKFQWNLALQLYQNYLEKNTYKKNTIQLLIQENFLTQAYYDLCIFYGTRPFILENESQKQDRLIANIYCSYNLKIQYPIQQNYFERKDKNYREDSWNFILSLYDKKITKNINLNKLNDLEKQEYFLHQANLALFQKNYLTLEKILKNLEKKPIFPKNEQEIYYLKAKNYLEKKDIKKSINQLTKLLYSFLSEETRNWVLLQITYLMLVENWNQEAEMLFTKINQETIPENLKEQYKLLKENITHLNKN